MIEYVIIFVLIVAVVFLMVKLRSAKADNASSHEQIASLMLEIDRQQDANKDALQKLNKVAYTNPITGLGNIDYFLDKSKRQFSQNPDSKYTLIAYNIFNIGKINQLFGPTEGDNVVLHAANILNTVGRNNNCLFAQIYSNLFGLIVKERSREDILSLMEEITAGVKDYSDSIEVITTFGVYEIVDSSVSVMKMVNACMLAQKFITNPTECNYKFYTAELEDEFTRNLEMSKEMEQAMEEHKFLMYLQPIVDLRTFRIISAEALVRWDHPTRGILSPYAFIPLFESTNLVQKLDYYMWEECLKTIRRWIDNKMEPTPISMNISPIHFTNNSFIDKLNELCEHYLIDKKLLILELPEQGISKNTEVVQSIVKKLKSDGYTLCVDNFGSINSPLNMLRDFELDEIKIDRSFLSKNSDSDDGKAILRYLIAMAKEVGLTVITEGVETLEQVNMLGEIGSDAAQGYFFSKPVNLRDFDALNHSMVQRVYQSNEYYPTFEDLEKDLDLIAFMLGQDAR